MFLHTFLMPFSFTFWMLDALLIRMEAMRWPRPSKMYLCFLCCRQAVMASSMLDRSLVSFITSGSGSWLSTPLAKLPWIVTGSR
uniref:Putative secreted protein n=1 Tax=Ixodes ricinus TaxID=34613 RepID=A0A6B0U8D4_IXORI